MKRILFFLTLLLVVNITNAQKINDIVIHDSKYVDFRPIATRVEGDISLVAFAVAHPQQVNKGYQYDVVTVAYMNGNLLSSMHALSNPIPESGIYYHPFDENSYYEIKQGYMYLNIGYCSSYAPHSKGERTLYNTITKETQTLPENHYIIIEHDVSYPRYQRGRIVNDYYVIDTSTDKVGTYNRRHNDVEYREQARTVAGNRLYVVGAYSPYLLQPSKNLFREYEITEGSDSLYLNLLRTIDLTSQDRNRLFTDIDVIDGEVVLRGTQGYWDVKGTDVHISPLTVKLDGDNKLTETVGQENGMSIVNHVELPDNKILVYGFKYIDINDRDFAYYVQDIEGKILLEESWGISETVGEDVRHDAFLDGDVSDDGKYVMLSGRTGEGSNMNFSERYRGYLAMIDISAVMSVEDDLSVELQAQYHDGYVRLPEEMWRGYHGFSICDYSGKTVLNGSLSGENVDVTSLSPGVYFIITDNGTIKKTAKFIVH